MDENEGDKLHRKALEFISAHPEKFGFKDIVETIIEDPLIHEGVLIAEVDVTLKSSEGDVYLIECKSMKNNGDSRNGLARKQLTRAAWYYGRHRPDVPYNKIHVRIIQGVHPAFREMD